MSTGTLQDNRHVSPTLATYQHLQQDLEGKLGPRLVTSSSHGPYTNKHHVPHGLSLGKGFPSGKVLPKALLGFFHANFGEQARHRLGIRNSSRRFGSYFGQMLFGLLHARSVALAERITRKEPSLGGVIGFARPPIVVDGDFFGL